MVSQRRPAAAGPINRIRLNDHTRERMDYFRLSFGEVEDIIHASTLPRGWHQGESSDGRTFNVRTRVDNLDLVVTRIDQLTSNGG